MSNFVDLTSLRLTDRLTCVNRAGNRASLQIFLIVSTCFLYLVAAGLFSKAVWSFEQNQWNKATGGDAAETGSGPGSYDIRLSVWHVNYANAEVNGGGGWGIFNALFGWENSATYGSVISYNLYWLTVIVGFACMRYKETRGHWPLTRKSGASVTTDGESSEGDVESEHIKNESKGVVNVDAEHGVPVETTTITEVGEQPRT